MPPALIEFQKIQSNTLFSRHIFSQFDPSHPHSLHKRFYEAKPIYWADCGVVHLSSWPDSCCRCGLLLIYRDAFQRRAVHSFVAVHWQLLISLGLLSFFSFFYFARPFVGVEETNKKVAPQLVFSLANCNNQV